MKIKRYLKNLWIALADRNPYEEELSEISTRCAQAEATAQSQEQQLCSMNGEKVRAELLVRDYQKLTENLRRRITDKEIENGRQRRDYTKAVNTLREQHRMQREELEQKNQELRDDLQASLEELQHVNHDIGREMMNTNLLSQTNNALSDLCYAMESEDAEKMNAVAEFLEWSSLLSRIAQYHLNVLMRKKELEERMDDLQQMA